MKKLIYIAISLFIIACTNEKKQKPNPNVPPKYAITQEPQFKDHGDLCFINEKDTLAKIDIEIAETWESREQGLMHRKTMKDTQGMLFIFDKEERQSFWMKNTHIPLDLIFVNNEFRIVHIARNCQPYSLKQIPSFEYARYVVEVNAGFCIEKEINVGQYIHFERE